MKKVSLERNSNGIWYIRYTVPGTERRVRVTTGERDHVSAEIKRREYEKKLLRGVDPRQEYKKLSCENRKNQMSLRDLMPEMRRRTYQGMSASTIRLYEGNFRNLELLKVGRNSTLVDMPMVDINRGLVNGLIEYRLTMPSKKKRRKGQVVKPSTVNRDCQFLHRSLTYAVQAGHIPYNPIAGMGRLKETGRRDVRNLQPSSLAPLLDSLPAPLNDIFEFCYYSMRRIEEVLSLRFEDVRQVELPVRCHVSEHKVKGGYVQRFPLSSMALDVINRQGHKEGYVFINPGTGDRYRSVHKTFNRHVRKIGLVMAGGEKLCAHAIRNIAATDMARRGVPNDAIAACLGHSNRGVTGRYISESMAPLREFENLTRIREKCEKLRRVR